MLFQDSDITSEEYYRQKDHPQRQIAQWEARSSDRQRVGLELTTTLEMVKRLNPFWEMTDGEDRKLLAHGLFDEITYDLDARRIVDFKLKAWAEPFLDLRAALYEDEMGAEMKNRFNSGLSSPVSFDDPNGASGRKSLQSSGVITAVFIILNSLYPPGPATQTIEQRNACIWSQYQDGQGLTDIARKYKLSPQRIHQIISDFIGKQMYKKCADA